MKMELSHKVDIDGGSHDTSGKNKSDKEMKDTLKVLHTEEIDKLKNRVRAFTGAFVVMISPVLLGIVLKKVNLAGARKYQGIQRLEAFVDFVQGSFAHLAAATLQMGTLPFLCVMISEACASLDHLSYVAPRLLAVSKVLVFVSNISLMALGCGILLLIHRKAWLVLLFCSIMVISVIVLHIILFWNRNCINVGDSEDKKNEDEKKQDEKKYHSKLEHLLELSAGITVMMFLVLECVALEGLLRNNSQGQDGFRPQPLAPQRLEGPAAKGEEMFLGGALLISFVTSMFGVTLMNVWTTPHVTIRSDVLSTKFMRGLSIIFQAVPITAVVILITLDVLPHAWKVAVWLPLLPPVMVLLVLLARSDEEPGDGTQQKRKEQGQAGGGAEKGGAVAEAGKGPATGSASSDSDKAHRPEEPDLAAAEAISASSDSDKILKQKESEDQKPAPLELTKVAFTGFLAVAVPSVTNAPVGIPSIFFVFFTATAVLLGLLWRLLTHQEQAEPTSAVLKAANHASFFAHTFISFAGVAFWVMAVDASK